MDQLSNEKYIQILTDLGLKPQEAKVYLACLRLGQAGVGAISKIAEVQRTFVYDILKDLGERGIVSSVEIHGKMHFSPISLEKFKRLQAEKIRKFLQIMPELKVLEKAVGDRPKVQFFEGREGIVSALQDTLNQTPGSEIIGYATAEGFYSEEPDFSEQYLKQRVKRKITARIIAPNTEETKKYVDLDNEHLRETRLVPADKFPFSNEIDIYGNKVAIINLIGEPIAVIIESESIAKTQRAIFELAWLGAGIF